MKTTHCVLRGYPLGEFEKRRTEEKSTKRLSYHHLTHIVLDGISLNISYFPSLVFYRLFSFIHYPESPLVWRPHKLKEFCKKHSSGFFYYKKLVKRTNLECTKWTINRLRLTWAFLIHCHHHLINPVAGAKNIFSYKQNSWSS